MDKSNNWLDISLTIHTEMPYWPDNPPVTIEPSQCLAHGIEGLDLSQVEPGEYELICLPIKLKDGDAGLARAILRSL